eukprot:c14855_g1_i1.p1 GENE.c14855_g1_i1~~c14855_g1_i1.p1  ORF type:complete len:437 (+),score=106.60 c14855_g1_i1:49-1311(+)
MKTSPTSKKRKSTANATSSPSYNPTSRVKSPEHRAQQNTSPSSTKQTKYENDPQDTEEQNTLVQLCAKGSVEEITHAILSHHGELINKQGSNDWTPLIVSTALGRCDIVDCLVKYGCDVNQEVRGTTALEISAFKFRLTGRPQFLHIADVLLGRPPLQSFDHYRQTEQFLQHPTNQAMAQIADATRHLAERQCHTIGCNRNVRLPYDHCGGRGICLSALGDCSSWVSMGWPATASSSSPPNKSPEAIAQLLSDLDNALVDISHDDRATRGATTPQRIRKQRGTRLLFHDSDENEGPITETVVQVGVPSGKRLKTSPTPTTSHRSRVDLGQHQQQQHSYTTSVTKQTKSKVLQPITSHVPLGTPPRPLLSTTTTATSRRISSSPSELAIKAMKFSPPAKHLTRVLHAVQLSVTPNSPRNTK